MAVIYWLIIAAFIETCTGYTIVQRPAHQYPNHPSYNHYNYNRFISHLGQPQPSSNHWYVPAARLTEAESRQLLELYYLIRVIAVYRHPASYPITKVDQFVQELTDDGLQQELRRLLRDVNGYDELAILGEQVPFLHSTLGMLDKERFVNDHRQLIPVVQRTLQSVRLGYSVSEELREKLQQLRKHVDALADGVMQEEKELYRELTGKLQKGWTITDILESIFGKQGHDSMKEFEQKYDVVVDGNSGPLDSDSVEEFWVVIDDSDEDNHGDDAVKPKEFTVPDYIYDRASAWNTTNSSAPAVGNDNEHQSSYEFKEENYEQPSVRVEEVLSVESRGSDDVRGSVEQLINSTVIDQTESPSVEEITSSAGKVENASTTESESDLEFLEDLSETITNSESPVEDIVQKSESTQQQLQNPGSFPEHYNEPNVIFESEKLPAPIDVSQPADLIEPKDLSENITTAELDELLNSESFSELEASQSDVVESKNLSQNITTEELDENSAEFEDTLSEVVEQSVDNSYDEEDNDDHDYESETSTDSASESVPLWQSENEVPETLQQLESEDSQQSEELNVYEIHSPSVEEKSGETPLRIETAKFGSARSYIKDEALDLLALLEESNGFWGLRDEISSQDLDWIAGEVGQKDGDQSSFNRIEMINAIQRLIHSKQLVDGEQIIGVLELWKHGEDSDTAVEDDGYFEKHYSVGSTGGDGEVENRAIETNEENETLPSEGGEAEENVVVDENENDAATEVTADNEEDDTSQLIEELEEAMQTDQELQNRNGTAPEEDEKTTEESKSEESSPTDDEIIESRTEFDSPVEEEEHVITEDEAVELIEELQNAIEADEDLQNESSINSDDLDGTNNLDDFDDEEQLSNSLNVVNAEENIDDQEEEQDLLESTESDSIRKPDPTIETPISEPSNDITVEQAPVNPFLAELPNPTEPLEVDRTSDEESVLEEHLEQILADEQTD